MAAKTQYLRHNPFARRTTIKRERGRGECKWCGAKGKMYEYGNETDAGRQNWDGRPFCSVGCYRHYHGMEA